MIHFLCKIIASVVVALTAIGCTLGIDDERFFSGQGNVFGVVSPTEFSEEYNPIYEANWVDGNKVFVADKDNRFLVEGVPAGHHDLIIREKVEDDNGSYVPSGYVKRITVRVVDEMTSIGQITLEPAVYFMLDVKDPLLAIEDARVELKEIPGEVVSTKINGTASFLIPPKGGYTFYISHPWFEFDPLIIPEDWNWQDDGNYSVDVPPRKDNNHNRLYHAYYQLKKAFEPAQSCTTADDCWIHAQWWKQDERQARPPPCPLPIMAPRMLDTGHIDDPPEVNWLLDMVHSVREHEVAHYLGLDGMRCPENADQAVLACVDNKCQYAQSEDVPFDPLAVAEGQLEEIIELINYEFDFEQALNSIPIKSQMDLEEIGLKDFFGDIIEDGCLNNNNCYYLFVVLHNSVKAPEIGLILDDQSQSSEEFVTYDVFLKSDISPRNHDCRHESDMLDVREECKDSWTLFKIHFNPPQGKTIKDLSVGFSWINAVE
jgi:hypothetical protein